ncbi:hypothetical protein SLEP1_g52109 [Rubroshorea leprosula]|uniref:CBS domain-containing protein n=1 Tax=Rubroshorea leprosula TaxID=152421 RepID=A0AAV5M589_9ROSI|nr:hypothetical protein SLEP1_g52109 [Rubroshorea leprosula]
MVFKIFKEQGVILTALLGLSSFFSMAETSITTLWPWKAAILLLTEITPKSIAVHNPTEVARFVAGGMAFLDTTSSGKNCYLFINGNKEIISSISSVAFLVSSCLLAEPYVSEDELKLMLRGVELSGAIGEEEQDMIETVLEIKDTHVREVMTPLVDVVAIDASATLVDFHHLWVTHQYSRVPVFEQRVDNIVGIAYAMDLLDFVWKTGFSFECTLKRKLLLKHEYRVEKRSAWHIRHSCIDLP